MEDFKAKSVDTDYTSTSISQLYRILKSNQENQNSSRNQKNVSPGQKQDMGKRQTQQRTYTNQI